MYFDARPSPARVSAAAAVKFPRWALFALLIVYIVGGLFGRDPWYHEDAAGFGLMWTMAHGTFADWWLPNVAGASVAEEGPLPFWIGALLIRLFGAWIGDAAAARLTTVLWFALATSTLWYATYRLARRGAAQPVAFAFGGQATPSDYGRMLADIGVLLFIGTLGWIVRLHETTSGPAAVAFVALTLFGLALSLERARTGAFVVGIGIGLLALARGPQAAAFLAVGSSVALVVTQPRVVAGRVIASILVLAVAIFALWPLASLGAPEAARREYFFAWRAWLLGSFAPLAVGDLGWLGRTLAWYVWPLWPLAAWALYAWRQGLRHAHIAVPASVALAFLLGAFFSGQATDFPVMVLAVPLALLASFGVVTVRRAAENAIDWFAIVTFSFFGLVGWAYFYAMQTGVPPRMAASVARLTPGFAPAFDVPAIVLALLASAAWIALVVWRVSRRPAPLWRGPLLAAGGLAMLWIVAVTLYLPAVNFNRSYAPIAREVAQQLERAGAGPSCVLAHHLLPSHRAMFGYHGGIRFTHVSAADGEASCRFLLQRDSRRTQLDDDPPVGDWQLVWEGRWPARPDETLRLYRHGTN